MQRHAAGVDGGDTRRRGNDHPLEAFFLYLVEECGFAGAGLACEKNILVRVADVFECEFELRIGNERHVLKFAMYDCICLHPRVLPIAIAISKQRSYSPCRILSKTLTQRLRA